MADIDPKILEAKQRVEADLLKLPGVTGVDIGYKEVAGQPTDQIAIRVLVAEKKDVPKAQQVPKDIEGIPTDVIQRKFELHANLARMPVSDLQPMVDGGTYTPLKGGISIGPCRAIGGFVYVGTLGCMVKDKVSGKHMMLSNFHVMCVDTTHSVGDTMAQPARNDGGSCPGSVVGTLARQQLGGKVDCAVADITGNRGQSCEIVDIGFVAGQGVAALGMTVRKRGRTTSLTYGKVDSVNLTVSIDYGGGLGTVTLTDQIGIKPDTAKNPKFGDHGDSGSVVVDDNRKVVGLYFAGDDTGYGVANPIAAVLSALNVELCTGGIKFKDLKDIRKDFKEIKIEKVEKLEHKELKIELKEKRELKEIAKLEHPEKSLIEKGGKELVEGGGFPDLGDPIGPIQGPIAGPIAGPITGPIGGLIGGGGFVGQAGATIKPIKELKDNSEKISLKERKLEKSEFKDLKHEKIEKPEKLEKNEKTEGKDKNEKIEKPEKPEKIEHKDKNEKLEKPELKEAKHEKIERKELKIEKIENKEISKLEHPEKEGFKEKDGKELKEGGFEGPGGPGGPGDPGPILQQQAAASATPGLKTVELKPTKEFKEFKAEKTEKIETKELHPDKGTGNKEIKDKEVKFEKNEIKELKPEKIEKNELKEIKHEKTEKNELKEHKREKIEHKELTKEFTKHEIEVPGNKTFKEKDGKELKESGFEGPGFPGGPGDPGPIFQQAGSTEAQDLSAQKFPNIEKILPDKIAQKEFKELKIEKHEAKEHVKIEKPEKNEIKEHKNELKELKHEKIEKNEIKEHKIEKLEHKEITKEIAKLEQPEKQAFKEKDGKELKEAGFEGPGFPGGPGDPGPIDIGVGPRIDALESALQSLQHFISQSLRPDLSHGALTGEPDLAGQAKAAKDAKDNKDVEKLGEN